MTKFNTGNPVGSADPRDFSDNAKNFDEAVNNPSSATWTDRLGKRRVTLAAQLGYTIKGDYAAGIELTKYNDVIRYDGEFYGPSASTNLPYITTATLPYADPNLVGRGDLVLRQDLASSLAGGGSDLAAHAGTSDTLTQALDKRTVFVGSVAELLSLTSVKDRGRYETTGFYSGSQAGGGVFVWDSAKDKALHDGWSVIDNNHTAAIGSLDWYVSENAGTGAFVLLDTAGGLFQSQQAGVSASQSIEARTQALQNYFEGVAAFESAHKTVKVGAGGETFVVGSNPQSRVSGGGIVYAVDNSDLIYNCILKLADQGVQNTQIVTYPADNLTVWNQKVDGDRDNNSIETVTRGVQYNFASYGAKNVVFYGGWSKNAMQNHIQSTSEVTFVQVDFETSGEHGVYLTAAVDSTFENTPELAKFEQCNFRDWGLIGFESCAGISGRDFKQVRITGGVFDPGTTGKIHILYSGEERSLPTAEARKSCIIDNVHLKYGPAIAQCVVKIGSSLGSSEVILKNSYVENTVHDQVDLVLKTTLDLTKFAQFVRVLRMAKVWRDCTILSGPTQIRSEASFRFLGGRIVKVDQPENGILFDMVSSGDIQAVFKGVTFENWDNSSSGVIRGTTADSRKVVMNGCYGVNSTTKLIQARATDVVINNVDLTGSGAILQFIDPPAVSGQNDMTVI